MAAKTAVGPGSIVCDIPFKGALDSQTRAVLLNELIKYILFEKNQMPEMFDQLKKHINPRGKNADPKFSNKYDRQAFLLFSSCERLFENIRSSFQSHPDIKESVIILGSSAISPKEVYHISFPTENSTGCVRQLLPVKESKRLLYLQIFAQDPFQTGQKVSCTNLQVLLLASRHVKLKEFSAKPILKLSKRGQHYHLNFFYKDDEETDTEVSFNSNPHRHDLNLSGFLPLDAESSDNKTPAITNDMQFLKLLEDNADEDSHIWYQANISIKGYRMTPSSIF